MRHSTRPSPGSSAAKSRPCSTATSESSPLKVSALCLGTMMFADQTDLAEARRMTEHAREAGVNFIDTADVYTRGASEAMVGELIAGPRDDWILATKVGNKMSDRPTRSATRAPGCCASARRASSGCAPTRSTCTTCTATTTTSISRSRCGRSTPCCATARSATGASPTSAAGGSPRRCTARGSSAWRSRWSASRTTTCSTGSPRSRCCRPACITGSAPFPTARSRAACSPPSTRRAPSPSRAPAPAAAMRG